MNAATRAIGQAAAAVAVAVEVVLAGSAAGVAEADKKIPDYNSKAQFQVFCEAIGGAFSEDGLGNTECHDKDGSWTECDINGNDCWYTPAPRRQPKSKLHNGVGGGRLAQSQDSRQEVAAVDDGSRDDEWEGKQHKNEK